MTLPGQRASMILQPVTFAAQGMLEIEVLESSPEYEGLSFDVVRAESFEADPEALVERNEAVFVPQD